MRKTRSSQGIAVLGSTGSVGRSAMDVIAALPERFHVVGLAAGSDENTLQSQIQQFSPSYASLVSSGQALANVQMVDSDDPLMTLATLDNVDIVVVATTGHVAIPATVAALKAGKIVALANKEAIVAAGHIVMETARSSDGELRPLDSEHSAIWQCLNRNSYCHEDIQTIHLTASGGPFRGQPRSELEEVTAQQALNHPTWSMGSKITIDSATLMNKGFELIEAAWLFSCPLDNIEVVIHPQSIVHSMVEFYDGAIIAQLGSHDMRIPIQYALTYPERVSGPGARISLNDIATLTFEEANSAIYPALNLARQAGESGSTYPTVLSCADSIAVDAFLTGRIKYTDIITLVQAALDAHECSNTQPSLEAIAEADRWTKRYLERHISSQAKY